jgi:hypothetical protein
MQRRTVYVLLVFALVNGLSGCDCDAVFVPVADDELLGTGTGDLEGLPPPCPGIKADWPWDASLACEATTCWLDGHRLHCDAAWALPYGHQGDFALGTPGDKPWNGLPHNADAGAWEDAFYRGGTAPSCGHFSINTDDIAPNADDERVVLMICTDMTAGLFTTRRIVLTDGGPVPDP